MVLIRRLALAGLAAALACGGAGAQPPSAVQAEPPFGGAIGGPFLLTDQTGAARGEADPRDRAQLLFFGYATCPGICSHALPMIAALTDRLAERGVEAVPVLITIDPGRDTVAALAAAVPAIHPDMVGLTGTPQALAAAREAFQVEIDELFRDPAGNPVFAHGGLIYLLDGEGRVLTVLPPVLSLERMEEIARGYLRAGAAGGRGGVSGAIRPGPRGAAGAGDEIAIAARGGVLRAAATSQPGVGADEQFFPGR